MLKNNIDWHLAELCIDVSKIVYKEKPEVVKFLKDNKIKHSSVKFFEKENAQGYGIVMPDYVIVAFRGTEGAQMGDLLADIKAWPAGADTTGTVHSGFKHELDKLYPEIIKWLGKKLTTKKIVITGHSLGAAMATICTSRMEEYTEVESLTTFGSPRVGTRKFVKAISTPHKRFVNNNDLVTKVPLFIMGYKHHGDQQYINFYGNIRKLTTWQMIKDKWRGWRSGILDGAEDHGMQNYVAHTEKLND